MMLMIIMRHLPGRRYVNTKKSFLSRKILTLLRKIIYI